VRAFARELSERPAGCASLLIALEECLDPPTTVILRGDPATCASWRRMLERRYRPNERTLDLSREDALPETLAKPQEADGAAAAWIYKGTSCLPPIRTLDQIEAALEAGP